VEKWNVDTRKLLPRLCATIIQDPPIEHGSEKAESTERITQPEDYSIKCNKGVSEGDSHASFLQDYRTERKSFSTISDLRASIESETDADANSYISSGPISPAHKDQSTPPSDSIKTNSSQPDSSDTPGSTQRSVDSGQLKSSYHCTFGACRRHFAKHYQLRYFLTRIYAMAPTHFYRQEA
jgi:hypothetical protein